MAIDLFKSFRRTSKFIPHRGMRRKGWRWGWWNPSLLLRRSEIILHWVESTNLTLQDDVVFVGCDVTWRHFIRHLGTAISNFTIFLRKSENNGNWCKIKPECLWSTKLNKCTILLTRWKIKNENFWQDLLVIMTFLWQHQISWTHGRQIKFPQGTNKQHYRINPLFKISKKPYGGGVDAPLYVVRPRVYILLKFPICTSRKL